MTKKRGCCDKKEGGDLREDVVTKERGCG